MKKKASWMSVFVMVLEGLEDSIAFSIDDKMSLVTVRVPAPPPPMDAKAVTEVRENLNMSQGVFAPALNVSPKTVQGWEQGVRTPSNASLRLLQIAREEPHVVLKVFRGKGAESNAAPKAVARRRGTRAKA